MAVLRLFVAIYPKPDQAAALLGMLPPQADAPGRDTPTDQVHLTCHFIGDRDERQLRDVVESLTRSCSGLVAPTLTPTRLITLPASGNARLLAVELDATPSLFELQRRLVTRLSRPGKSADRFLPHITLRRYGPAGGPRIAQTLDASGFQAHEVCLVKSVLHAGGASHAVIHREKLDVAG